MMTTIYTILAGIAILGAICFAIMFISLRSMEKDRDREREKVNNIK